MSTSVSPSRPSAQIVAERAFAVVARILHVEAVSGAVLIVAAVVALLWANSPWAASYDALWHLPVRFGIGDLELSQSLHFLVNEVLMAFFFLVVGMEIRREMHVGALASFRLAALPLAAALGGVVAPAAIYWAMNGSGPGANGWAVPTATDIAFAVGVLALLGKAVPANVRVLLLALAIIDDIVAVLIIAVFYSGQLDYLGLPIAAAGILAVLGLQRIGIGSALAYVVPGAVLWFGLLKLGVHPTLAGVVLGLLTPVVPGLLRRPPLDEATRAVDALQAKADGAPGELAGPLRRLRRAQREVLPPVSRVQMALHPWVAFGVMPLFALANAGVALGGIDLGAAGAQAVMLGVWIALVAGKPLGIFAASWLAVRFGGCLLPSGVTWAGISLLGLIAGIGFTMSIFVAGLAFADPVLLGAAKLGVLLASASAALIGLGWGWLSFRRRSGSGEELAAAEAGDDEGDRQADADDVDAVGDGDVQRGLA